MNITNCFKALLLKHCGPSAADQALLIKHCCSSNAVPMLPFKLSYTSSATQPCLLVKQNWTIKPVVPMNKHCHSNTDWVTVLKLYWVLQSTPVQVKALLIEHCCCSSNAALLLLIKHWLSSRAWALLLASWQCCPSTADSALLVVHFTS